MVSRIVAGICMVSVMAYFAIIMFSAKTPEPLNYLLSGVTSRMKLTERWTTMSSSLTQSEGSAKADAKVKENNES